MERTARRRRVEAGALSTEPHEPQPMLGILVRGTGARRSIVPFRTRPSEDELVAPAPERNEKVSARWGLGGTPGHNDLPCFASLSHTLLVRPIQMY